MSGRGRGRGRGRGAPVTGARMFMQRSAQEAGLDAGNLRSLHDLTRPKSIFPPFEWHSSGRRGHDNAPEDSSSEGPLHKRSKALKAQSTVYLINKSREIHDRFQNSPFYVRPRQEADVVRYSKRPRPMEPDINIIEHIGKGADDRYLPAELLQETGKNQQKSMKELSVNEVSNEGGMKKELTLEEMAANELKRRAQQADPDEGDREQSDTLEQEEADEDEEDEGDDYMHNHYESEGESDGGGGEEPTM